MVLLLYCPVKKQSQVIYGGNTGIVIGISKKKCDFVARKKLIRIFALPKLSDGVIGNTSDFGSEESRFEPWSDN